MIQLNELRIGNYVVFKRDGSEFYFFIEQISKEKVWLNTHDEDLSNGNPFEVSLSDVFPIPLSDEMILKCGFKERNKSIYYKDNFEILTENEQDCKFHIIGDYGYYFEVEISCVHQLQNLYFALKDTELEVQLC